MPGNEALLSLLSQKMELVFQLLRMANDTEFNETSIETNAEKFIAFVDAREETVDKLKKLNEEIVKLQGAHGIPGESSSFNRAVKEMTDQITRLELGISKKTLGIMAHLQQEMKDLSNRKRISGAYDFNDKKWG